MEMEVYVLHARGANRKNSVLWLNLVTKIRECVYQDQDVQTKKIVKEANIVRLYHNIRCVCHQKDAIQMEDVLLCINVQRVYIAFHCDDAETEEDAVEMNCK